MAVVQPVNYGIAATPVNAAQALAEGMAVGQGLVDAQQQAQNQAILRQKANADMAQKAAERDALLALQKAPSQRAAADILLRFPGLKEQVTGFMGQMDDIEKKERVSQMTEATGFLVAGDKEGAANAFRAKAQAYANAGRQQDADALNKLADQTLQNPDAVRAQLQLRLEALDPEIGKRLTAFEESRSKVTKEGAEARKIGAEADIKATEARFAADKIIADIKLSEAQRNRLYAQSKLEADRLGLDRDRLALDKAKSLQERADKLLNLSEPAQKRVVEASDASVTARQMADKAGALAKKFEDMAAQGVDGGRFAMLAERAKKELGMEDAVTQARAQYDEIKASKVLSSLPPGSASDTDIALASKPLPESTSDPKIVASYLRGLEKISRISEEVKRGEADYVAQNGGVGMARGDMNIAGVDVPAGATYGEFMDALQRRAAAKVAGPAAAPTGSRRTGAGQVGR